MLTERQVVRQLDILRTLQAHRRYGITTAQLAEEYGTTPRTIQRDLNDLREAGFWITTKKLGDGGSPHFLESENLPPINFPLHEIAGLLFIETLSDTLEGTPFKKHLQDLIRRIQSQLGDKQTEFLRKAAQAYAPHIRGRKPFGRSAQEVVANLNRAILEQQICQVAYQSIEEDKPKEYPIEPLRLLYYMEAGGLYLIARVSDRDKPITMAVERIQDLQPTQDHFKISAALSSSIEERLRNSFGIISSGKPFHVCIYFTPGQAPYIREREWHPSQEMEDTDDGGVIISFHASSAFEIKRWVLQHGAAAQVLKPDWLCQEIEQELRAALSAYRKK
jgi:predicted DNA-binding transcriptional regulator YafY